MIEFDHTVNNNLVNEYITDDCSQTLTILPNEELKIVVTVPHSILEWYVDVFDRNGTKVYSNWRDHFGDVEAELRSQMKESIEGFILAVTRHPLRVREGSRPGQSVLQIYRNDEWTDVNY